MSDKLTIEAEIFRKITQRTLERDDNNSLLYISHQPPGQKHSDMVMFYGAFTNRKELKSHLRKFYKTVGKKLPAK